MDINIGYSQNEISSPMDRPIEAGLGLSKDENVIG
jgi:hypothetical protein